MILVCRQCGTSRQVKGGATVQGVPIELWWQSVGGRCQECRARSATYDRTDPYTALDRAVATLIREFDAEVVTL